MGVKVQIPPQPLNTVGNTLGSVSTAPVPSTPVSATAAANTAVVVTIAGVALQAVRLTLLSWSYSAAPAGGLITVVVNGVTIYQADITAAGVFSVPLPAGGLECQSGQSCVITLAAAGAAVVGRVSVASYQGA